MSTSVRLEEDELPAEAWMVRPCAIYREEYDECGSGRLHQRYVYGKTLDCEKWMADWKNCLQYEKTKEPAYLMPIIEQEKERRQQRLAGANCNDVWSYRNAPPKEWSQPLPSDLQKEQELFRDYERTSRDKLPAMSRTKTCVLQ